MKGHVCNYAVARFRPYRETGEFVNVGVVLLCPQLGFLGHHFERRKHKRITDFFPELGIEVFKAGLGGLLKELNRFAEAAGQASQFLFSGEAAARIAAFKELVRPRETLFHFGEMGTVFAADPKAKLQELFAFHVERQFAQDREYQETIMRHRLGDFLRKANLSHFYKQDFHVGNADYSITLPFVHLVGITPRKAIKPLHLDKTAPTDIYRHGDAWVSVVRRLRQVNCLPKEFLFTVKHPTEGSKHQKAAKEICNELETYDTRTVGFEETDAIRDFAQC